MAELRSRGIPPMPGLDRLMTELGRRGLPWGVATSSRRSHAKEVLDGLGLLPLCQAMAAGDEVQHGKPAPDIYLLAAQRLGTMPEACLAIEDSVPGAQAAVAAGMVTIAVPSGQAKAADFGFTSLVFSSLLEVADKLDGILKYGDRHAR